jgi:hypothetical protein
MHSGSCSELISFMGNFQGLCNLHIGNADQTVFLHAGKEGSLWVNDVPDKR